MLTSITPLGERGRGNRFWLTRAWLLVGHAVGGLALGALLAGAGALGHVWTGRPSDAAATSIVVGVAVIAVLGDLVGIRVPGRRQVDERWLTTYRGWVYGFGFGAQLGFGLVTVVNTLLLAVVLVAGVVLPPAPALALGGIYGVTRGVAATVNGRVRTVEDLRRFHRRLDTSERLVRFSSLGAVLAAALGAMVVA